MLLVVAHLTGTDRRWWGRPSADPLDAAQAAESAVRHGVALLADNPGDPHAGHRRAAGRRRATVLRSP